MASLPQAYVPAVLVDTDGLPEETWLEYRRKGIGGSDAAAILGVSPFATARDLYYDKLNLVGYEDRESNWVAKKVGHLLEDLVAEIFHVKTGYRIYQIKKMFYHPLHSFMLADIDYFIDLPNGKRAILEIKTTHYQAKDHWWRDGEEVVPINYEVQGRHYMCVMNVDEVFFCCLYSNSENDVIIGQSQRILMPLRYMTAHKLMRYAEDEFARFRCTSYLQRDHHYDNMESLLSDYCDYLLMCEGLNYDLKSDFVLFPRDLPQAHDAVNELSDEAVSAIYNKRIAADFERLEQRYHFQSGGLLVTAPHSADELVAEGHKLRHCVGGYIKKVACNDCTILFIREAKRPDKPFCTVELQNGDVYQARVYKNHQPPAKVQRFIDRWKNEVLYTAADIQEAA